MSKTINYCGFTSAVFVAHCFGFAGFHYLLHLRAYARSIRYLVIKKINYYADH